MRWLQACRSILDELKKLGEAGKDRREAEDEAEDEVEDIYEDLEAE